MVILLAMLPEAAIYLGVYRKVDPDLVTSAFEISCLVVLRTLTEMENQKA